MNLVEVLSSGVLLGDGANGTLLETSGFHRFPYDLANLEAPELVLAAHQAYFNAGSDFVETNTFQASSLRMQPFKVNVRDVNIRGAQIARQAAGADRLVFGAIGPIGKALEPIGHVTEEELAVAVKEQALALAEGGVDAIMLETYIDLNELRITAEAIKSVTDLPIIASKAFIEDGDMISRGFPFECAQEMADMGFAAVGANCIVGPQRMLDLVRMISESVSLPILAMPTPGMPQLVKGQVVYDTSPDYFAKATARLIGEGAGIIGGCCGTTPEHISHLRREIGTGKVVHKPELKRRQSAQAKVDLPVSEPSELSEKINHKFVVAVEMDVPRGLSLEPLLAQSKKLKIAGADVINISDGARARLRVNPMAVSDIIQRQVGIEVTMHFSCRDRNMLAVQADLLACHALGIRNILAVTGDPATIGDYPSATSVFDIDSVGLIRIMARFNRGIDLAGYSVGKKCAFTIACAYNPLAYDVKLEQDRLKAKVDAGAQVVYTQPIFDRKVAEEVAATCQALRVPFLLGLLPLKSQRHCEFMHNEVPGIEIPEGLRAKMAAAPDDATAYEIGLQEACDLARASKYMAQGLYLMPPAGDPGAAIRIIEAVR